MDLNQKTKMSPTNEAKSKASAGSHGSTFAIDPIELNIVNRIASGSSVIGHHQFFGGVLVQGCLGGKTRIDGHVLLWEGGVLEGDVDINGDLYVLGQIGRENMPFEATSVRIQGVVYAGSSALSVGTLYAKRLQTFAGAQLIGPFMTLHDNQSLFADDDGDGSEQRFSMS